MLQPLLPMLKSLRIVLASGSPRRQELIKNIGLNVEICPSLFEENLDAYSFPSFSDYVEETALQKALEVSHRLRSNVTPHQHEPDIVISADTAVVLDGKIYGKPKTPDIGVRMLTELMGRQHTVYTGVVIMYKEYVHYKFTESTKVYFGHANREQIQAYVDTGEPLDKAGGYGIQGIGGTFVERIDGDYFTVMGLPVYRLSKEICNLLEYNMDN